MRLRLFPQITLLLILTLTAFSCHAQRASDQGLKVGDRVLYRYAEVGMMATITRILGQETREDYEDDGYDSISAGYDVIFVKYDGDPLEKSAHPDDLLLLHPFVPTAGEAPFATCTTFGEIEVLGISIRGEIYLGGAYVTEEIVRKLYYTNSVKKFFALHGCK